MWQFSSNRSIEKIENIHKRCVRLTLNDYKSDHKTPLDKKDTKEFRKIRRVKTLAIEIFKTVNELNPNFMKLRLKQILQFNLLIY